MPGINVGPEAYGWLALAQQGIVTVTYSLVSEELPGMVSISPAINMQALKPEHYRKIPSANALAAIIEELQRIQDDSVLKGLLALNCSRPLTRPSRASAMAVTSPLLPGPIILR